MSDAGPDATVANAVAGLRARVLVVDDDPAVRRGLARLLLARGHEVLTAEDAAGTLALLASEPIDVAVVDLGMPAPAGLSLVERVRDEHPEVEVVAMGTAEAAHLFDGALARGAYEVVERPFPADEVPLAAIARAAERRRLLDRIERLEHRLAAADEVGEIVGTTGAMRELKRLVAAAAATDGPVLVVGEQGVGKELVARTIHVGSRRADRPLVRFDAGAIPADRHERELFGTEERGTGLVAEAHRATLLLVEIGALSPPAQARLLTVLDAGEPRIVATSTSEPKALASSTVPDSSARFEGRLRDELRLRLSALVLHVPPLRQRKDDLPVLAYHALRRAAERVGRPITRIGVETMRALRAYRWPGNLDELEQVMVHAVVSARKDVILPNDLPPLGAPERREGDEPEPPPIVRGRLDLPYAEAKRRALVEFDRAYLEATLARAGGNVSEAARLAGLDRSNFRRAMKKAGR